PQRPPALLRLVPAGSRHAGRGDPEPDPGRSARRAAHVPGHLLGRRAGDPGPGRDLAAAEPERRLRLPAREISRVRAGLALRGPGPDQPRPALAAEPLRHLPP